MESKRVVESANLWPLRRVGAERFDVSRGNGCLNLVRTDGTLRKRSLEEPDTFRDPVLVCARASLFTERDQLVGRPRPLCTSRVGDQHQRKQAADFRLFRQQLQE